MRRWVWRVLLLAAAVLALTGTALAAEVRYPAGGTNSIRYDITNGAGTVLGPVNKSAITKAEIPSAVNGVNITKIAANAFEGCTLLDTVEIGKNVAAIGESAFINCTALKHLYFSKGSSVSAIEKDAFSGCSQLNNVILPSNLTTIRAGTFSRCTQLDTIYIPANVQTIEATAFYMDGKLLILHYGDAAKEPNQGDSTKRIVHFSLLSPSQEIEAATCTVDGKERVTASCELCVKDIITEEHAIPATGHTPGDAVDEVPATCVSTGTTAGHYCTVCGNPADGLEMIPVNPDNHESIEAMEDKAPTCTEKGSTGGKQCTACGVVTEEPQEEDALGHIYAKKQSTTEPRLVREATCGQLGQQVFDYVCDRCGEVMECEICKENEDKGISWDHLRDTDYHPSCKAIAKLDHTWGEKDYDYKEDGDKPTCSAEGKKTAVRVCTVCGEKEWDEDDTESVEKLPHTPPEGWEEEILVEGDCETPSKTKYPAYECTVCRETVPERIEEGTAPGEHTWAIDEDRPEKVIKEATCKEEGETLTAGQKCTVCGKTLPQETKILPKTAHSWGTPVKDPDPKDKDGNSVEDKAPTCGEEGVEYVIVTCQNKLSDGTICGETEHRAITLPATGRHDWGEWVTREPTLTQPGEQKRVCKICGKEDVIVLPATGDSTDPDDPGNPSEPEQPKTYRITLVQGAGGAASVNRTTAQSGDRITVTLSPDSGYELDMIRAIGGGTDVLSLTDLGGGQHRFTMPAANVEVRVTFERRNSGSGWAAAPGAGSDSGNARRTTDVMPTQNAAQSVPRAGASEQRFRDIPMSHWAAGEIEWANQMGYMNGSEGRFNPDGAITHQQMWMVLARLTGANPANMAEARRWAVERSFADGSSPTGTVTRHQLVTALYRCAHLMGSSNRNTTSLAGYADSRTVPAVARDAFSWALANGIVSGTANGRLDPNGNVTRAQFAVILYRYSQRV